MKNNILLVLTLLLIGFGAGFYIGEEQGETKGRLQNSLENQVSIMEEGKISIGGQEFWCSKDGK